MLDPGFSYFFCGLMWLHDYFLFPVAVVSDGCSKRGSSHWEGSAKGQQGPFPFKCECFLFQRSLQAWREREWSSLIMICSCSKIKFPSLKVTYHSLTKWNYFLNDNISLRCKTIGCHGYVHLFMAIIIQYMHIWNHHYVLNI